MKIMNDEVLFHTESYYVRVGTTDVINGGAILKTLPIYEIVNKVTEVVEAKDYILPNTITACIELTRELSEVVNNWNAKSTPIVIEDNATPAH